MGAAEYGYYIFWKSVFKMPPGRRRREAIQNTASTPREQRRLDGKTAQGFNGSTYTVATNPASVNAVYTQLPINRDDLVQLEHGGCIPLPSSMGGIPTNKSMTAAATMIRE